MATSDIGEKVRDIIAEVLDADRKRLRDEARFIDELGADSLGIVELVLALEEAFGIEIPEEDTEKMATVGDAIEYIASHVEGG